MSFTFEASLIMDPNNLEFNCVEVEINDSNETQVYSLDTDEQSNSDQYETLTDENLNTSPIDQHQRYHSDDHHPNCDQHQQEQEQQPDSLNDGNQNNDTEDVASTFDHNNNYQEFIDSALNLTNYQSRVNRSPDQDDSDGIPEEILEIIESLENEKQVNLTNCVPTESSTPTINTAPVSELSSPINQDLVILFESDGSNVNIYQENSYHSNLENNLTLLNCPQDAASNNQLPIITEKPHQHVEKDENNQSKGYQESTISGQVTLANPLNTTETISKQDKPELRRKPNYQCDFPGCDKSFNQKAALKLHCKDHTEEGVKSIECPICHGIFDQFESYNRHMRYVHNISKSGKRYLLCEYPECKKMFTSIARLSTHKKTHKDTETRRYVSLLSKEESNIVEIN